MAENYKIEAIIMNKIFKRFITNKNFIVKNNDKIVYKNKDSLKNNKFLKNNENCKLNLYEYFKLPVEERMKL